MSQQTLHRPPSRLRRWLLSDRFLLCLLGAVAVLRGIGYLPTVWAAPHPHPVEAWLDRPTWGLIWVACGLAAIVAAFARSTRCEAIALGVQMALNTLWCISYLAAYCLGDATYTGALTYAALVVTTIWSVWRNPLNCKRLG